MKRKTLWMAAVAVGAVSGWTLATDVPDSLNVASNLHVNGDATVGGAVVAGNTGSVGVVLMPATLGTPTNWSSLLSFIYLTHDGGWVTNSLLAFEGYGFGTNGFYREHGGMWYLMWDAANQGPGSGLNADLLDGHHGDYYLSTSGGTIGDLTVSGTLTAGGAEFGGPVTLDDTLTVGNNLRFSGDMVIGNGASAAGDGVAVGNDADGYDYGVAVGSGASAPVFGGVAVGYHASAYCSGAALGAFANADSVGCAIGYGADAVFYGVAIGNWANGAGGIGIGYLVDGSLDGIAMGTLADGSSWGTAIGQYAYAPGVGNVALGADDSSYNPAEVPDGWQDTVELGRGMAVLDGGLNFRGYGIVDENGSVVAPISGNIDVACITNALAQGIAFIPPQGNLSMGCFTNRPVSP